MTIGRRFILRAERADGIRNACMSWAPAFVTVLAMSVMACSESDFVSSSPVNKKDQNRGSGQDGDSDVDQNGKKGVSKDGDANPNDGEGVDQAKGELEFDDETLNKKVQDLIEEFSDSGKKISVEDSGLVLQLFTPEDVASEVDVAFVIDMSGSMDNEIKKIEQSLDGFLTKLAADEKTKNIQLFVLAGKNDNSFTPPAVLTTNDKFTYETSNHSVDSFNLLAVTRGFLDGSIKTPKIALRPKAKKHVIFVSDDQANRKTDSDGNPKTISETDFTSFLTTAKKDQDLTFHGIVCITKVSGCEAESVAYKNLATQYKGIALELTSSDWTPIFDKLKDAISAKVGYDFVLQNKPTTEGAIKVYLDGKVLDPSDYSIDEKTVTIDERISIAGKKIIIAYQ